MTDTHTDMSVLTVVRTREMAWQPSPSSTVWRKRLFLSGPVESGQVTSIVRFEPGASFHRHGHPQGEEIFVLDGVFSDEQGDFAKNSYLLNPEGFEHAPHSDEGCLLFVRLRQHQGLDRTHVSLGIHDSGAWARDRAVRRRTLYAQPSYADSTRLEHWIEPGEMVSTFSGGAELYVISGGFDDRIGSYREGDWIRYPAGSELRADVASDTMLYIRLGHLL
jgi:hypothetical protein